MRLSISSFEFDSAGRRAPHKPWNKICAVVFVLLVMVIAALEIGWRRLGVLPGLANTSSLWALEVDRLKEEPPGGGVVLIGSSRIQNGLSPTLMEEALRGARVYNLSMSGHDSYGALVFLAEQTEFSGTLVLELWPSNLFWSGQPPRPIPDFVKFYGERSHGDALETQLDVLVGSRLVLLHPELTMIPVLSRLVASRFKAPLPLETLDVRRYGALDIRQVNTSRAPHVGAPMSPRELDALIERYKAPITRLRSRGVRVVAYNPPLTGVAREQEEQSLPRDRYWDVFVSRLGVTPLHYADDVGLNSLRCYDGSHLDSASAAAASQYVATFLSVSSRRQAP